MKQTGYPNGRPGYVIDHIEPLACFVCPGPLCPPGHMRAVCVADAKNLVVQNINGRWPAVRVESPWRRKCGRKPRTGTKNASVRTRLFRLQAVDAP